jgi:molybdopterin-guanine dinucleotide biosynthesis protein A
MPPAASDRPLGTSFGPVAAAVIAGGGGTRLGGVAKAGLTVGGRSIAERQLATLRGVFARVLVIANDPAAWEGLDVEIAPDVYQGAGPLGGIHAALSATFGHAGVVCVAGDMPFVEPRLAEILRDRDPTADAVVPRVGGFPEPLLARYGRRCLSIIEGRLAVGEWAVHAVFDSVGVSWIEEAELRALDPHLRSFTNINTPEDLARAQDRSTSTSTSTFR